MDQLLQPATPPLELRRQDARQGLCYGRNDGAIGGVETNPIHLSQAAELSHQAGPPHYQREINNVEFAPLSRKQFLLLLKTLEGLIASGDKAVALQQYKLSVTGDSNAA